MRWEWWEYPKPSVSIDQQKRSSSPDVIIVVDGNHRWTEMAKVYSEDPAPATDKIHTGTEPWGGFFGASSFSPYGNAIDAASRGGLIEAKIAGTATVDGVLCTEVYISTVSKSKKSDTTYDTAYYIDLAHIVRRSTSFYKTGSDPGMSYDNHIVGIKLNEPIAAGSLAYKPGPGVKPYRSAKNDPKLLHVGMPAHDFGAVDQRGKTVRLSDFRGRAVLIDFWGVWCHACREAMPDNQIVMRRLQASGTPIVMLAVDDSDERADFDKWMKSEASAYPSVDFVYAASDMSISVKQYKVNGFPTQYLVDKDGIIRATFVGSDGQNDELVKAVQAALK
jgi:peroxiredoxin